MNIRNKGLFVAVFLTLALSTVINLGNAWATVVYLNDGAMQQADGTWDLPTQGFCYSGNIVPSATTRPECLGLRMPKICVGGSNPNVVCSVAGDCLGGGVCTSTTTQAICEGTAADPTKLAWTTSVCNLPAFDGNSGGCLGADGMYSNGKCALSMEDDSRNVATCVKLGGTWVTSGVCTGKWYPPNPGNLLHATPTAYGPGPGDQCLRCHNLRTQYNGTNIRWIGEYYMRMGHMNVTRKVAPVCSISGTCSVGSYLDSSSCQANGATWTAVDPATCVGGTLSYLPWAGPSGAPYPSDDNGNPINWTVSGGSAPGTVDFAGTTGIGVKDLYWIFGDWLTPLPAVTYKANPVSGNPGVSYECARCHTTGWTSDAVRNDAKEPEKTFFPLLGSHITWDGVSAPTAGQVDLASRVTGDPYKMASWDQYGVKCSRCHMAVVDNTVGQCTIGCTTSTICNNPADSTATGCGGFWNGSSCQVSSSNATPLTTKDIAAVNQSTCTGVGGSFGIPYAAPIGMGTHNGGNTGATSDGGYCSNSRYTREAACESAGNTWFTDCGTDPTPEICTNAAVTSGTCTGTWVPVTGWCSGNTSYTNQTDCVNNTPAGQTWWQTGLCKIVGKTDPDLGLATKCSGGTGTNALTYRRNGSQASCLAAGATWNGGYPSCSIPSICSKPDALGQPITSNKAACDAVTGTWTSLASEYTCIAADGEYTGTKKYRGQIITSLCMECHRQDTGGLPYDSTNPATALKVGPTDNSVGFLSYMPGNMFLNSVHAQYTGTFDNIAKKKKGDAGGYASNFMDWGEAKNTGNGCTGCHNPHKSTVDEALPEAATDSPNPGGATEKCTECHTNAERALEIPQVDITKINHLSGAGTPLENVATNPSEACQTCHMPGKLHLWRINADAAYSTYPAGALSGTVNANTAADATAENGTYTNAVWVDLDLACGQCHGGGTAQAGTTGSITYYWTSAACTGAGGVWSGTSCNLSKVLTVASTTGFTAGNKVRIAGAGALEEDGATRDDLNTYILSVDSPTKMTLVGDTIGSVAGAAVTQNATKNGAPYRTKSNLSAVADGIHSSSGVSYPVTFVYTKSGLTVNATAQVDCGGACPTFTYDWSWGDGLSDLAVVTATKSHTYGTAGKKTITLTVNLGGLSVGTATRSLTVTAPDLPPVANANCTVLPAGWNANTWTMTIIDTSTDTDSTPVQTIAVDWGDGSSKSFGVQGGTFVHKYNSAGTYTVTDKAIDTALKYSVFTCVPSPTAVNFTISGTVKNNAGTVNLASALVVLLKNGNPVKTAYTAANGTFSFTALKPATYTLKVTKSGYTFTNPAATKTVGPDQTAFVINALP
jgi:predicted CXXCH cytochrome family protein